MCFKFVSFCPNDNAYKLYRLGLFYILPQMFTNYKRTNVIMLLLCYVFVYMPIDSVLTRKLNFECNAINIDIFNINNRFNIVFTPVINNKNTIL